MIINMLKSLFSASVLILTLVHPVFAEDCDRANRLTEQAKPYLETHPSLAEQKLHEAIAYCEKSAALHYNLGVVLMQQSKNREAIVELEEALRLRPSYAKAMNDLASVLYLREEKNDYERALQLAKKAVNLDPPNRKFRETYEMINAFVDVPPVTAANNANAIAVVIGNRNYKDPSVPAVDFAERDAETMKRYLVDALGFREGNIMFYQDAKYTDLLKLFGDSSDHKGLLYNRTRQGLSDVFIFYSGHGAPDTNTQKAYLAPSDVDPSAVKHTSYSLDVFYENLAKLNAEKKPKSLTLVIDACFSGASGGGMIIGNASPIYLLVTTPNLKLKDAAIFTSSQGNQISSWYPEQKHGLFTYLFLKAIKETLAEGKPLTTGEIEQRLLGPDGVNDNALRLYSREQVPQITGSKSIVLVK